MRPGDLQVYTTLWMNLTNSVERNKTLEYILEDSVPIKAKFIYGVITHKGGWFPLGECSDQWRHWCSASVVSCSG